MKFTKKQRHEIYKKAKEIYINKYYRLDLGICASLGKAVSELGLGEWGDGYPDKDLDDDQQYFPEFIALKPEEAPIGYYWWALADAETRIQCLNICIERTI